MEVTIRQEAGYTQAIYGFSLSYKDRAIKPTNWICDEFSGSALDSILKGICQDPVVSCKDCPLNDRYVRSCKAATANAGRGKGHDKFLRQIMLWIDIEMPRYFWSEWDTYKVGTVAQSESTIHTLANRNMQTKDLAPAKESYVQGELVKHFNDVRSRQVTKDIQLLKQFVPESYLQRRLVTLNYGVLRCIIDQRSSHKLPEWRTFIDAIYEQCEHPELLPKREVT